MFCACNKFFEPTYTGPYEFKCALCNYWSTYCSMRIVDDSLALSMILLSFGPDALAVMGLDVPGLGARNLDTMP